MSENVKKTHCAPSILSISYNPSLLHTRELILKSKGFQVISVLGFTPAMAEYQKHAFDLVIVGHSIPNADKEALVRMAKQHPHTRVLSLGRRGESPLLGADYALEASEGPEALVSMVKEALDGKIA